MKDLAGDDAEKGSGNFALPMQIGLQVLFFVENLLQLLIVSAVVGFHWFSHSTVSGNVIVDILAVGVLAGIASMIIHEVSYLIRLHFFSKNLEKEFLQDVDKIADLGNELVPGLYSDKPSLKKGWKEYLAKRSRERREEASRERPKEWISRVFLGLLLSTAAWVVIRFLA